MYVATSANLNRPIEIVAVDAMQVYRGMNIGTAKPTTADQQAVHHHGIDLVEPSQRFTVAQFQQVALAAIDDMKQRNVQPLLVAGTGLYLQTVIDGFTLPSEYPQVRAGLETLDTAELFAQLHQVDPEAANKMEPTNRRRIVRALEVCKGSGKQFSSFGPGATAYPKNDVVQIGLRWPREALATRIEHRVHKMMEAGWLQEVKELVSGGAEIPKTAQQALGYRELIAHLDGELSLDEALAQTIVRTKQFAVRQERWFRRDPRIQWIDLDIDPLLGNPVEVVAPFVLKYVGK